MSYPQTSLISILSCEHGRLRRIQRDISKRDLQKALKHGSRTIQQFTDQRGKKQCRLKIEYEDIVFITDALGQKEITSFPSPLSPVDVLLKDRIAHEKAIRVIDAKPELCASHTVLVVDNSGSMATHDIPLHRDRQVAAYTMTALELVAEQLLSETANNSDLVSLVEFSGRARVVFSLEPVSWVLYNKLLSRRDARLFKQRENARSQDQFACDSNYLPALELAETLLMKGTHDGCALSLLFLSDGMPTDARSRGLTPSGAVQEMKRSISRIAKAHDDRLNIMMVGFGNQHQDFSALEGMVTAANEATGKDTAKFVYCGKIANALGTAVTTLVSSSVATRTSLQANRLNRGKTTRNLESEEKSGVTNNWRYYRSVDHSFYNPEADDWQHHSGLPAGALRPHLVQEANECSGSEPPLLALNQLHCGSGAERVAFRCNLADRASEDAFRFGSMVAKETKTVERIEEHITFHKSFCKTQNLAAHLAEEFNKRVRTIPGFCPRSTPRIEFLECSILILEDFEWPGNERGVLVEKLLDTEKFPWRKWNNNAGAVDGIITHAPIDVDRELAKIEKGELDMIEEGDSDEEGDSEEERSDGGVHRSHGVVDKGLWLEPMQDSGEGLATAKPTDYVQAFTHFSYLFTNKQVMVCDLQGVYNTDRVPPAFELSDPAIHYASTVGRKMVFGHTDLGKEGMELFFKTHKCTPVCKYMNLSQKNKKWKKQWKKWRQSHDSRRQDGEANIAHLSHSSSQRTGFSSLLQKIGNLWRMEELPSQDPGRA
jgi:Alpha-kinase family/von Willebrand factor type A domain